MGLLEKLCESRDFRRLIQPGGDLDIFRFAAAIGRSDKEN
jgi:hypothetical protein